jgi:hypothetical protein
MIATAIYLPLLALAASVPAPGAPAAAELEAAAPKTKLRVFASGTPIEGFFDAAFDTDYSGGLEGEILFAPGPHLRLGVGLRYELGHVPAVNGRASSTDEFWSVPLLIGAAVPLRGRHEVELLSGIGIGIGSIRGGTTIDGVPFMQTVGITTELSVTYWMPIARAVDLSLGAAVSLAALHIENGEDGTLFHIVLPLRIGARWSL